jgi:hypothetical protein
MPPMERTPTRLATPSRILLATSASGAAVMIIELAATRALAPAFGSSFYTWTNVIGVVLLALACGYGFGGRLADRHPSAFRLGIILALGALLTVPMAFFTVPLSTALLPDPEPLSALTSTTASVVKGSLIASLLLFAPPVFLLGMVAPHAARCLTEHGLTSGTAAGRTLAAGTLGSVVGTYLPAHVLLDGIGIRATVLGAAALLAGASALLLLRARGDARRSPRVA